MNIFFIFVSMTAFEVVINPKRLYSEIVFYITRILNFSKNSASLKNTVIHMF